MEAEKASVTEAQWLRATDADSLLWLVRERRRTRKLRLFACACCRRIWHLLPPAARKAVAAAERYADRLIKDADRHRAHQELIGTADEEVAPFARMAAICASLRSRDRDGIRWVAHHAADAVAVAAGLEGGPAARQPAHDAEREAALALVREVFGNPFRQVAPDPALLAWTDGTVPRLAQAAYDRRRLPDGALDEARLAVLADALEEAGYPDANAVAHLREPGPHVRGCWVVDLLLGKG